MKKFQISNFKYKISNIKLFGNFGIGKWKMENGNLQEGFTLIELLIVIVIISILSTIAVVNYMAARVRARDAQRKSNLQQIQSALELYRADQGAYPASLAVCGSPMTSGTTTYIQKVPCDPTNSGQYIYHYVYNDVNYTIVACLENTNDQQKDAVNNVSYCAGGSTNWSYTITNL